LNEIYTQEWHTLVQGQVYLSTMKGHLTPDHMHQFDHECTQLFDASPYPLVHIIHDTCSILSLPSLGEVRKITYPFHNHMGFNIAIGVSPNPLLGFMLGVATSIFRSRFHSTSTLVSACTYLMEKDPSLPPLSTWHLLPEDSSIAT
jgi:hypothetical protein